MAAAASSTETTINEMKPGFTRSGSEKSTALVNLTYLGFQLRPTLKGGGIALEEIILLSRRRGEEKK
jgi:hypothetical protein